MSNKSSELLDEILEEIVDKFDLTSELWDDDYELRRNEIRQLFEMLNGKATSIKVGFKRLTDDAVIPTKAHPTDSGFDLYASEDVIVEPGETAVVKTGIAVKLPPGYEAQVRPRSGVTSRTKLRVQIGTIDNGYAGEIGVIVDNKHRPTYGVDLKEGRAYLKEAYNPVIKTINNESYRISKSTQDGSYLIRVGDRIAQLVIQPLPAVESYEIDGDIEQTERGAGGFGSTGVGLGVV